MLPKIQFLYRPDGDGDGNPSGTPAGDPAPAPQPNPAGQSGGQQPQGVTFTPEQQAHLNTLIAQERRETERRIRESDELKALREKADKADQLEEAQKTDAEKLTDRATKAEAKAAELEPQIEAIKAERDALAGIVEARVKAEIKDWPAEVKALIPEDGDLIARLGAIEKARPIAAKLMDAPKVPGNGHDPRPLGAAGTHAREEDVRRGVRSAVARQF